MCVSCKLQKTCMFIAVGYQVDIFIATPWKKKNSVKKIFLPHYFISIDFCFFFLLGFFFKNMKKKSAQCTVYANDLNPRSYHYLGVNAKLNKVNCLFFFLLIIE